jgi:nucleoside-triphosphatase THEP1
MGLTDQLDQKWLKASVLGCLWASSEIVLGSFLHNLRVPFSGNILTAIGLILLISISHLWKEKGLFWRSGLVCALMKTVSPSAVIFGPMLAILSEAILLELSTRIFGRTWAGFIIGGILAMSWNLFHRIANLIIVYGLNIVDLYTNLVQYAQKQLHIEGDITWKPIFFLWIFYFTAGLLASMAGIYIGRKAVRQPVTAKGISSKKILKGQSEMKGQPFYWSILWLMFNISGMVAVLFLMNKTGWKTWMPASMVLLFVWGYRYHRALRPLKKPKFWIFFGLITMLSSYLFVRLQHSTGGWMTGLMAGLQMNFRAAVMIVGFSAIGTELYNPLIRKFFERTYFRQLPLALEVAFYTLPEAIAKLPAARDIIKSPVSVIHQLIAHADYFLEKVTIRFREKPFLIILTGGIGEGKTTFLYEIAENLIKEGIQTGGIISPAVVENGKSKGYDIINVTTGLRIPLSRIGDATGVLKVGPYIFSESGLDFGKEALSEENNVTSKIILVDEVGPWELEGQGWAESINELLLKTRIPMIWVVRETIADQVIDEWNLTDYKVFRVKESSVDLIVEFVRNKLK